MAEKIQKAGELFSRIGLLFKDPEIKEGLPERIKTASRLFIDIAEIEEDAYTELSDIIIK